MITATINGNTVEVAEGTSILDAAKTLAIKIPTLCKHPDVCATAACGICIVRLENSPKMLRACCTPLENGMNIITHDPEIVEVRRSVVELIMSRHPNECLTCGRNGSCELQDLCADFGIRDETFMDCTPDLEKDDSTGIICLDPRKCVSCGRCVEVCQNIQDVHALCFENRGFETKIAAAGVNLNESPCVSCGQCSAHCPTGAIVEQDETAKVWEALQDPEKHVVVQIAPATRVAIGEMFDLPIGTNATGKFYAALRRMKFDKVFDTNFGADLTIMEEGSEFLHRLKDGGTMPLITSCCPAWVDFMEKYWSHMIDHFSTAKSPHEMVGVMAKTYYAEKNQIPAEKIFVVSVMPCTAKKWEIQRHESMHSSGYQDVDVSLTTREIGRMIKQAGIDFANLPDEGCDLLLGEYTGAGTIFGATGGVMEAALRTAYELATGQTLENVDFEATRGLEGIKEAAVDVGGTEIRIAIAHGLANVEAVLAKVQEAKEAGTEMPYHFIEVMACPGGCVGGGGQPYGTTDDFRQRRAKGLYDEDAQTCAHRKSHENVHVQQLYKEFLGQPLSEKAHHLLHTHYQARQTYVR